MKAFVQFTVTNTTRWDNKWKRMVPCTPYQYNLLGSDGVYVLDGRQKLSTWIIQAKQKIQMLSQVQPNITGFKIMQGNFRDAKCIHIELCLTSDTNEY